MNFYMDIVFLETFWEVKRHGLSHPLQNFAAYYCRMLYRSILDAAHSAWLKIKNLKVIIFFVWISLFLIEILYTYDTQRFSCLTRLMPVAFLI